MQVPVLYGALIEGVATLICRLVGKYLEETEPKYAAAIDSFISTSLVVAGIIIEIKIENWFSLSHLRGFDCSLYHLYYVDTDHMIAISSNSNSNNTSNSNSNSNSNNSDSSRCKNQLPRSGIRTLAEVLLRFLPPLPSTHPPLLQPSTTPAATTTRSWPPGSSSGAGARPTWTTCSSTGWVPPPAPSPRSSSTRSSGERADGRKSDRVFGERRERKKERPKKKTMLVVKKVILLQYTEKKIHYCRN